MDGLEDRKQVFIMAATNRPGTYVLDNRCRVIFGADLTLGRVDPLPYASRLERVIIYQISYFSTKTYTVNTQKSHLNETVLLGI